MTLDKREHPAASAELNSAFNLVEQGVLNETQSALATSADSAATPDAATVEEGRTQ